MRDQLSRRHLSGRGNSLRMNTPEFGATPLVGKRAAIPGLLRAALRTAEKPARGIAAAALSEHAEQR
jgi:hypothetical protein